jgi:hypothetical protein
VATCALVCARARADEAAATQPAAPDSQPSPPASPTEAGAPPKPEPKPEPKPTPKQVAARHEGAHGEEAPVDPRARPYFIKGELSGGGAVRPLGKRSFIGAGMGVAALPSSAGTALNAFFFTVEPQVDLRFPEKHDLKIGLSVPLAFEIADTRAAFESCVPAARDAKAMGATQQQIAAVTAMCVDMNKGKATENLGQLRKQDWDEPSDFAKVIRYITIGGDEQPFYLNISRLYGHTLGHGTVVRRYNPNLDYNTSRVGVSFDAYRGMVGFESMVNDVIKPDVMGALVFVRPFEALVPDVLPVRSLSFGAQLTAGLEVPRTIGYEVGLFDPAADKPIPELSSDGKLVARDTATVVFYGADVETKVIRTQTSDMKIYFDVQQMKDHGRGLTLGALWRFSFGRPATQALRVQAEVFEHDADYLPYFFDSQYDIQKLTYFPSAYTSGGLQYQPTKLGFIEAAAGGRKRLGASLEVTHTLVGWLTVGVAARGSRAMGSASQAGFAGPQFDDLSMCTVSGETPSCAGVPKLTVGSPGYASVLVYGEIPFRRVLQAFASYEVFSTSLPGEGLDLGELDGDNEIVFTGVRLQLLPILFAQAEARRFYFTQRLSKIDTTAGTLEQDQNPRASWTFAINIYAGLEF